ncbi:MAG TPA: SH3 domain-containing protein [Thermomicrobiales bacterium]|nr:SH3 domain-containing protein [Thermomicrobiales bacterium]
MATLSRLGQRVLALALVCAMSLTMLAPTAGANANPDQTGLYIGAQATIAYTGGAGVLLRTTPGYDGAVVTSLGEGTTVTVTEGPVTDTAGQSWYGVLATNAGYVPAFTLAAVGSAPAISAPVGGETAPTATPEPVANGIDPVTAAQSVPDTAMTLLPGTAMITATNGDGARCRATADYSGEILEVITEGTVVVIAGPLEASAWQPVICATDRYGYVHTDFVTYAPGEEPLGETGTALPVVETPVTETPVTATVVPTEAVATEAVATEAPVTATVVPTEVVATEVVATEPVATETDAVGGDTVSTMSLDVSVQSFGTGVVTGTGGQGVRCRAAASTTSATITVLAEGTSVTTRGAAQGGWMPVTCGGQNGFAYASFISSGGGGSTPDTGSGSAPTGPSTGMARITGTGGGGLNCRATASYSGSVIAVLGEGSSVTLRGAASGEWQPVTCGGMGGYVHVNFISTGGGTSNPVVTPPASNGGTTNPGGSVTGSATITGTGGAGLICRSAASSSGSVLMVMPEGSTVSLNGSAQGVWQPVRCGSQNGFAHSGYLGTGGGGSTPSVAPSTAPTANPVPSTGSNLVGGNARVTSALNLRYSASYSSGVSAVAPAGTVVVVTSGPSNGFYRVDWDGLGGYMHGDYLVKTNEVATDRGGSAPAPSVTPAPSQPSTGNPGSGSGSSLVNYAMQYLGYPYVWAGAGPYGFDCSGFTMYVVQNVMGKNITHDMAIQISMGSPVARSNLQPGDLIFFQNTFKWGLSHVGIYIGNGQFIHAENEQTGVRISDLNSQYYSSRWYGAVRY